MMYTYIIVRALGKKAMIRFLSVLLALFPLYVSAEQTTELNLNYSTCSLKERGWGVKNNPISVKGFKKTTTCHAFIKDEVFNRRYKFCVYSGFRVMNTINKPYAGWYGCSISREKKSFMFEVSFESFEKDEPSSADMDCKFMCFLK